METDKRAVVPRVDAHCHLDLYPDYRKAIAFAEAQSVATVAVTNTPSVFLTCQNLLSGSKYLRPALGLHPELVRDRHTELSLFRDLIPLTRFIGEVGLDYVTGDMQERSLQRRAFSSILEICATFGDRILTVHSRRAALDVISLIGDNFEGRVILHWFSGPIKAVDVALGNGFYFSINPAMTRTESGKDIIAALPKDRVLTETDGPFSVGIDRTPLRPGDVDEAISYLAQVWSITENAVHWQVYRNFRDIVRNGDEKSSGG